MSPDVWTLTVGTIEGVSVAAVFVLGLLIGFCVLLGLTKLRPMVATPWSFAAWTRLSDGPKLTCPRRRGSDEARVRFGLSEKPPIVRNSDAHLLADVGTNTCQYMLE